MSFSSEEEDEDVDDSFDDDDDDESYHPSGDESSFDENSVDGLGKLKINFKHVTRFFLCFITKQDYSFCKPTFICNDFIWQSA